LFQKKKRKKKKNLPGAVAPLIPTMWETLGREIEIQAGLGKNLTPYLKNKTNRARGCGSSSPDAIVFVLRLACFVLLFETGFCFVVLKHTVYLPQPSSCWYYRQVPPHPGPCAITLNISFP
jgi:hypothetical protein